MTSPTQGWHIDKSIGISNLVATVLLIVGGLSYLNNQDKRISANAQSIEFIKTQRQEDMQRIEKRLESIDKKLDKIIGSNIYAKL